MRHSTTIDGKNDVKNGKRSSVLAALAGAFSNRRDFVAAYSSPQPRARETGEIMLAAMGLDLAITSDETFTSVPAEMLAILKGETFTALAKEHGWTLEEAVLSPLADEAIRDFIKERGVKGLLRTIEIAQSLADGQSAIVFTHGGGQIEPITIAAYRTADTKEFSDPFDLAELPEGACLETEGYDIFFDERDSVVGVKKVTYGDAKVVDLIRLAKKERF